MNPMDDKDFQNKFSIALDGIALDFQESLKDKLTKEHGRDTSALISNIKAVAIGNEVIISMPEHGLYLEFGTPGTLRAPEGMSPRDRKMPPVEELYGWVSRKFKDETTGKGIKKSDVPDAAWALAIHIKKFGTRPFPFIRNTFEYETVDIVRKNFKIAFK